MDIVKGMGAASPAGTIDGRTPMHQTQSAVYRDLFSSAIADALAQSYASVTEDLVMRGVKEVQRDRQQAMLEAASVIRLHGSTISARFAELLATAFAERMAGADKARRDALPASGGLSLSLVEDNVISDRIVLDRIIQKLRGKLDSDQVLGMRARLSVLAGRDAWFDENRYPGAPDSVVEALRQAIDESCTAASARTLVLEALAPALQQPIGEVYQHLNNRLVEQGILPKVLPRVVAAGSAAAPAPAPAHAAVPEQSVSPPTDRLSVDDELRDLLRMIDPGAIGSAEAEPDTAAGVDRRPVDAGLAERLQWLDLLFEHIEDDHRIHPQLMRRLRTLKSALEPQLAESSAFFESVAVDQPARRALEAICWLGTCPDLDCAEGASTDTAIASALAPVLAGGRIDWSPVAQALEALVADVQSSRLEAREQIAARALRLESFMSIETEARAALRGLVVPGTPRFVVELLERGWARTVAMRSLAGGQEAREAAMDTAAALVWSVMPKEGVDLVALKERLPGLLAGLRSGLAQSGVEEAESERFLQRLLKWHARLIQQARGLASGELPESSGDELVGAAGLSEDDGGTGCDATRATIDAMAEGDTIAIRMPGEAPGRFRVAWIGPARRLFVLVQVPAGTRFMPRDELAQLIESAQAQLEDRRSAVGRALREITMLTGAFRPM